MSRLQLIIVLETNSEEGTDSLYFHSTLDHYFQRKDLNGNEVNIQYVFLNGKQNYNSKTVVDKINNYSSMFNDWEDEKGESQVIYCLDTDSLDKEYKGGSFFRNVQDYCQTNNYDLVWFCKNAENVFLNVEPETLSNKILSAITFARNGKISNVKENNLSKHEIEYGCSNILLILSKYLIKKR